MKRTNFGFVVLSLFSAAAIAQPKPPDAGQILESTREPLRLPPPADRDVRPRPPEPRPALPAQPQLKVNVKQFNFTGNTIFSEEELRNVVREFLGRELDFDGLNDAATKVRAYHRERGYFLAQAYLPQQAIRNGTVEIAIIEGRVGLLELDRRPASRLSETLLAGILGSHLAEGDVITETGLERPLLLINDLPTAQITSEIRPSRTVGAADLRVNVDQGGTLINGYADYDNQGNRFTGEYRTGVNFNINSPTGYGDQATFRGFVTDENMWYGRFAYLIPVWYYGTRIGISYSKFSYKLSKDFAALGAEGEGDITSIYGFHPIVRTRNTNVILQFSYEDKQLTDRILSTNTLTERSIGASKLGVSGDFRDGLMSGGLNQYAVTYTRGHVGLSPNTAVAADIDPATGHKTQGQFGKINAEARRLQRLTDTWTLLVAASGQRASKNLQSAEKFSLGGANGVRAYPASEASADSGFLFTTEARYIVPGFKVFEGDITLSGFYDYGAAKLNQNPLTTDLPNARHLAGYGVGMSLGRDGDFLIKASAAWEQGKERATSDTATRIPRVWLQAVKWF